MSMNNRSCREGIVGASVGAGVLGAAIGSFTLADKLNHDRDEASYNKGQRISGIVEISLEGYPSFDRMQRDCVVSPSQKTGRIAQETRDGVITITEGKAWFHPINFGSSQMNSFEASKDHPVRLKIVCDPNGTNSNSVLTPEADTQQ